MSLDWLFRFTGAGGGDYRFGAGELFVHRNIANQVISTDLSLTSVLQYGLAVLKVRHIIVCGHYNCGGVAHSMKEGGEGPVDRWLGQLRALRLSHAAELAKIADEGLRLDRMVELSTVAQLSNLEQMPVVQQARASDALQLHAWVYDLRTGHLKELECSHAATADRAP